MRFLLHDAMQARPMPSCGVCLCVSVTFVYSVKKNKHIFEFFSPSGSQTILVFSYQAAWQYSDENPLHGGVECRWSRQKSWFWAYIWLHCPAGPAASYWQHLACCNRPGVVTTTPPDHHTPASCDTYRW